MRPYVRQTFVAPMFPEPTLPDVLVLDQPHEPVAPGARPEQVAEHDERGEAHRRQR